MMNNVVAALTMFIAIAIPFFGGLLGFFGGFALAPTSYYVTQKPYSYIWFL